MEGSKGMAAAEAELERRLARIMTLKSALLKCREEFCWHGNTGKTLSGQSYGELVDMIDEALDGVQNCTA